MTVMKRRLVCALFVLLAVARGATSASATPILSVSPPVQNIAPGGTAMVNITISDVTDPIGALMLTLGFDQSKLVGIGYAIGPALGSGTDLSFGFTGAVGSPLDLFFFSDESPEVLALNQGASFTLASVMFIGKAPGIAPVSILDVTLFSAEGSIMDFQVAGGANVCIAINCMTTPQQTVPEPGTLGLMGTALASLAAGRRRRRAAKTVAPMMMVLAVLGFAAPASADAPSPSAPKVEHGQLPMSFELNEGQADAGIKALSRGNGYGVLLTADEFILSLTRDSKERSSVLRFKLVGGNPASAVSGADRLPGTVSYFTGNDRSKWRSNIATYAKVKYDEVYPGIDLVYYGNQRELEYDFVVAPGADPSNIRLAVSGARSVKLGSDGQLLLGTNSGTLAHSKPVIYQHIDGRRETVSGSFTIDAKNRVGFELGTYDPQYELVIDPSIGFFTYFGGTGTDQIKSIAVTSPTGLTFYSGLTTSLNLPGSATPGAGGNADGFISAMGPNATSVLLTVFLGGTGTDAINGLALDPAAVPTFLAVAGITNSADFPAMNAAQATPGGSFDAFVARFDISIVLGVPSATMSFSTFLGGSSVDQATGVAVATSATGSGIFVTGATLSTDFPTLAPYQAAKGAAYDMFVAKYGPTGTRIYSTYAGWAASEQATGIAVYSQTVPSVASIPYVSATLSLAGGKSLALVLSLNNAGSALTYAKVFGAGTSATTTSGIAVDGSANAYITGATDDAAFPMVSAVQPTYGGNNDAFVMKLNAAGNTVFSTYLGGVGYDRAHGIAVDTFAGGNNNIVVGGLTTGFFPTSAAPQAIYGGGPADGFVVLLAGPVYSVGYSTYLGGTGTDVVYGVSVGSAHNARVAGITNSAGLATAGVAQSNIAGELDGFVVRIQTAP